MLSDKERLLECTTCLYLMVCNLKNNERDDENGHCTEYVEDKKVKDKLNKYFTKS